MLKVAVLVVVVVIVMVVVVVVLFKFLTKNCKNRDRGRALPNLT